MNKLRWHQFQALLRSELISLTTVNASDRPWQTSFCAALATGLPILIGTYFGHQAYGLVASLGGLVFVYTPRTPLAHRMVVLMASGCGMSACYTLGLLSHLLPLLLVPVLTFIAILVSMVCRFYVVGPPGSQFYIMAAAIGAYSPVDVSLAPLFIGLQTMGSLLAVLIAFIYSLYILRQRAPQPVAPLPPATFDYVIFDSVVIGVFVGVSLALAQALSLERAYWVPVSCVAIMQGSTSLHAVWVKQIHRIVGTCIGLLLTWCLFKLPLNPWSITLTMMTLSFVVETLVVRNHGLAAIFITPLTILLVEASHLGHGSPDATLVARLHDTILGAVVGLLGGVFLHNQHLRTSLGRQIRRLSPARLRMN